MVWLVGEDAMDKYLILLNAVNFDHAEHGRGAPGGNMVKQDTGF